jgi:hypothetical protein
MRSLAPSDNSGHLYCWSLLELSAAAACDIGLTMPMETWKTAWTEFQRVAGVCRIFHDLKRKSISVFAARG